MQNLDIIKSRTRFILIALILGFPCIILRLFIIQVVEHTSYSQLAAANLDRYKELPPLRGVLYDRNHTLLAKTAPSYDIYVQLNKILIKPDSESDTCELNTDAIENFCTLMQEYNTPITIEEVKDKITTQYQKTRNNINQKLEPDQELKLRRPQKYKRKKNDVEKDWFSRPYVFMRRQPLEIAEIIMHDNVFWDCEQAPQVKIYDRYSGFSIGYGITREYSQNDLACQLLGHLGSIPDNMRTYLLEEKDYAPHDQIGLSGIERLLETELRGHRGCYVHSKQGIFFEPATDGFNVVLTIDAQVQQIAEKALDETIKKTNSKGGAAVVVDVYTGEILVLASSPRFDNNQRQKILNEFAKQKVEAQKRKEEATHQNNQETIEEAEQAIKDIDEQLASLLLNRAISRRHTTPPGSVFKIATALYALENGIIDEKTYFDCRGYLHRPGAFRCTHHHGSVNVVKAIEGSCNVFFYQVGERMGYERLIECAKIFGYGSKSGLGFPEENAGLLPPNGSVGDNRMFGIGQRIEATPLQVARSMAMVARRGIMPQLKIVKGLESSFEITNSIEKSTLAPIAQTWTTSDKNWRLVWEGMRRVTEGHDGTATALIKPLQGLRIAAKTGTSEVTGKEDHAWFAGYAPFESPRYAFVVYIENGGYGGSTAGPVAVEILHALMTEDTN